MADFPVCPKCAADYTYRDGALLVCPSCAHEWDGDAAEEVAEEASDDA